MDSPNKILAALDLDAGTERVLAYALWLAETKGPGTSGIYMLHVMDYALTPPAYLMPYIEKEKAASEETLKSWQQKLRAEGVGSDFRIAIGRLVESFSKAIKERAAEAMVLGYKSHLIRPSSSERIIKSVNAVPVMVIRGQKSEAASLGAVTIERILCAVDFSENSKRAVDFARGLAGAGGQKLSIVNAVSSIGIEESFRRLKDLGGVDKENYKNHVLREAEEKICSYLQVCSGAENIVKIGVPYKTINETAAEKNADLIVMGARGLSYTEGVILGSVTESVIKSSPCPVIIIH